MSHHGAMRYAFLNSCFRVGTRRVYVPPGRRRQTIFRSLCSRRDGTRWYRGRPREVEAICFDPHYSSRKACKRLWIWTGVRSFFRALVFYAMGMLPIPNGVFFSNVLPGAFLRYEVHWLFLVAPPLSRKQTPRNDRFLCEIEALCCTVHDIRGRTGAKIVQF